jgi:hypothetical protein
MEFPASACEPGLAALDGSYLLRLSLILSFSCTGLDEFLRTPPAQLSAQSAGRWLTGSLITLPLFAVAVWAGDWIARRAGLGLARRSDLSKRALIIALLSAVAVMPVWLAANRVDGLARSQALITPGSRGSADVYWVSSGAVTALLCVCLLPAGLWTGRALAARVRRPGRGGRAARAAITVTLLAVVPALAWLLHQTAGHAYASQVSYTSAAAAVPPQSHVLADRADDARFPPAPAAPDAFAAQTAHALQDGLAGQAAGFPLIAVSLLLAGRRSAGRDQHGSQLSKEAAP